MATPKQIEANRRNARKSTGPRTVAGKAVSSMNALKTGIDAQSSVIRGEDPNTLQLLTAEYYDRYQPATPEARALVDTLISSDWLLRRLRAAEAQLWEHAFERQDRWDDDTGAPLGHAFAANSQAFSRLQRRIDSAERNYHRALKELRRVQPSPPSPDPPPQPVVLPSASREIGFVPSTANQAHTGLWGGQSWPQPPFRRPNPLESGSADSIELPAPQVSSTECHRPAGRQRGHEVIVGRLQPAFCESGAEAPRRLKPALQVSSGSGGVTESLGPATRQSGDEDCQTP